MQQDLKEAVLLLNEYLGGRGYEVVQHISVTFIRKTKIRGCR
jgi:hypothetical protein